MVSTLLPSLRTTASHLEQYSIADFLEFRRSKRLTLNPDFQRRSVWSPTAKVYLIDTILRGMPMPKVFLRTVIDPHSQTSIREVVDGQQRLRTVFEFADGKLRLTSRAKEFSGYRYHDLPLELQQRFLSYTVAVEQLINASNNVVLEVFSRINSYNVKLNAAELRHAEFQSDFRWAVYESAQQWSNLWDDYGVFTLKQRARMADDELMAEMFRIIASGIVGGEARLIYADYKIYEQSGFPDRDIVTGKVDRVLSTLVENLPSAIAGPLASPPHFLMLFAATAYVLFGIPEGNLDKLPKRPPIPGNQDAWDKVRDKLLMLASVIENSEPPTDPALSRFWTASRSTTQNIASRRTRFPVFVNAFNE